MVAPYLDLHYNICIYILVECLNFLASGSDPTAAISEYALEKSAVSAANCCWPLVSVTKFRANVSVSRRFSSVASVYDRAARHSLSCARHCRSKNAVCDEHSPLSVTAPWPPRFMKHDTVCLSLSLSSPNPPSCPYNYTKARFTMCRIALSRRAALPHHADGIPFLSSQ